nr:uncharacterized protein LOC109739837 isoform X2 [Aegilops tauschii subsp. strangulata]
MEGRHESLIYQHRVCHSQEEEICYFGSSVAWHGKRARDTVRAGGGCGAGGHVGHLHTALLDHLRRHRAGPRANLRFHGAHPTGPPPACRHLRRRRPVHTMGRPAAVRLRRQLPAAEVLTGAKQGLGHDLHFWRGARPPRRAQLRLRHAPRSWPIRSRHDRERHLVDHHPRAVHLPRLGLLPGGVEGVLDARLQQHRRLRQAVPRLRRHALVGRYTNLIEINILEVWYYTAVLILVGLLKNAQLEVDIMSVCINYQLWAVMVALGLNGAVSVRVSNELGANKPKAARFSVIIAVSTSAAIGAVFLAVFLAWRTELPRFFSDNEEVVSEAAKLGYLLAATIFLNSIQPVLTGVVIGAGWQTLVAFINIGCYYLVGIPLGFLFGFKLKLGALGIWAGMSIGTLLQTVVLLIICFRTKWKKQAMLAEGRIREWGGSSETLPAATNGGIDR